MVADIADIGMGNFRDMYHAGTILWKGDKGTKLGDAFNLALNDRSYCEVHTLCIVPLVNLGPPGQIWTLLANVVKNDFAGSDQSQLAVGDFLDAFVGIDVVNGFLKTLIFLLRACDAF